MGLILINRRVSGRVLGDFIAFAYYLRAGGGYRGGLAAAILAYEAIGLAIVREVEAGGVGAWGGPSLAGLG